MNEFFGERIKERREALHMKQDDLAKASNVSRQTISALENGRCENVLVGTLLSIAKALDTTIDNFFCTERPKDLTQSIAPPFMN
jgi:transcriptional regulator with XRE-family HTH domain